MKESVIRINVQMDENKIPANILWQADDSNMEHPMPAKAMLLAFWDKADKTALRMDLWTKDMMIDEMADFFYQTFMTMADTYQRATQQLEQAKDIKNFAQSFMHKFRKSQENQKTSL